MLSQALLSAVERDLAVARQLAYFHVDLCAGEGAGVKGASAGPFRHHAASPAELRGCQAAGTNAVRTRVVLSNPVQRPRQGTCAVLIELSRPLNWLSLRRRHRCPSASPGISAAARAGVTATMCSAASSHIHHASAAGGLGAVGVGAHSSPAAGISSGASASAVAGGGRAPASSSNLFSGTGASLAAHVVNSASPKNAALAASSLSDTSGMPLLIATMALEVVFTARYPREPCQWKLFEEVSFAGVGDHSTSSWAVTADHHRSNTTGESSSVGYQPDHLPDCMASPAGCRSEPVEQYTGGQAKEGGCGAPDPPGTSSPFSGHGTAGGAASTVRNAAMLTLTAFVVPEVGRRLLQWIAEARPSPGGTLASPSTPLATAMASDATANMSGGPTHQSGSGLLTVYPFLSDFAVLLLYWSAVELDLHHLILPPQIALAYGGDGTRVPRVMTSTHLSGGGGAAPSAATSASTSAPAALLSPATAGGTVSGSAETAAGATGAPTAGGGGALYAGATSSTASIPAPASGVAGPGGVGTAATGGGVAAGTGAGASALYPFRRRPAKSLMALLLPQGNVAVLGASLPPRRACNEASATNTGRDDDGPGTTAPRSPSRRLPLCLRRIYEAQQDGGLCARMRAGTVVICTSQFKPGKVLPSYVLPAHVLGTAYKCDWSSVRFFSGKTPDVALHANAKLAKALRLPDVSDLLQVLRRLAKNVGTPSTGVLYIGAVLWPALMETVRVLRNERLPFWAGMAVCSLLLPSVLQQVDRGRPAGPNGGERGGVPVSILPADSSDPSVEGEPRAQWRCQHLAELIGVVSFAERVIAVAQEHTLLCEVRLVRFSLQRGLILSLRDEACGQSHTGDASKFTAVCAPAFLIPMAPLLAASAEMCRRLHAPISICAVCGLSLLRNTVTHADVSGSGSAAAAASPLTEMRHYSHTAALATGDPDTLQRKKGDGGGCGDGTAHPKSSTEAVRAALRTWREEGCLVVQCARCGHGGHVEHISSWWNDPTVRCCPKGCDCRCIY
ncbi:hypothetical protein LSCM1_05397 [Leishmania martiniquensis]|uniref:Uncharacterized protein n=1 Tax=Leishmania martiniquensis TaxID=1580590 RepID=A0A836G838_9TRYP|nr:hypothetical protein LSCM1_05397 [Leishmania martiniquensis]